MAALDILYFLDGIAEGRARVDMVKQAMVFSGMATPMQAWPDFFPEDEGDSTAFPSTGSDMSAFTLENATPQSFADDMAALVEASRQVVLREPVLPEEATAYNPSTEWM